MLTINPVKVCNTSFGTYFNTLPNEDGEVWYRGDTKICRDDLCFPEVVDFLDNKYKNVPKVNVIMHACSDGEEVYSFLGVLISKLNSKASKFLPLSAKDIDRTHLKLAKRGVYNITESEYITANRCMSGNFYNFFDPVPSRESKDPRLRNTKKIKVERLLKSLVKFEQSNILEDAQKINFKNAVIFARNFWPYLSPEDRHELAKTLSNKMDESSTLIIGNYDKKQADMVTILRMYGFEETKVHNVFEKRKKLVYY